jgi:DNA mismatch endonuclease, patch repair protein
LRLEGVASARGLAGSHSYAHRRSGTTPGRADARVRIWLVTDFLPPATRSRVMARIRSKNTKPEMLLRRTLYGAGVRGWRCHPKHLPGKPDLAFTRRKVAVFVDGCFWHGHPDFFTAGKSGPYWDAKIERTQERDRAATAALEAAGWRVLRLWDFEVERDPSACAMRVVAELAARATSCEAGRVA